MPPENDKDSIHFFKVDMEFNHEIEVTNRLMEEFANLSKDQNPLHCSDSYGREVGFTGRVAYGNLLGSAVSFLVGMGLPTQRVMLIQQNLDFKRPVYIGDRIHLISVVSNVQEAVKVFEMKLVFRNHLNEIVGKGKCLVKCL